MRFKFVFFRTLCLLAVMLLPLWVHAQTTPFEQLFQRFKAAAQFDHAFPREKVYLHLDNNAYMVGETMWLKAYVVRASSLQPTTLSGVLYVELLNADGDLVERKLLQVDEGQAYGEFKLDMPVRAGFYEVRAYTREMLNWGSEACFSRVIPIFEKNEGRAETALEIPRPENEHDLAPGHSRPYDFKRRGEVFVDFYPEGGNMVKGMVGRVAFRASDAQGRGLTGGLSLFTADGRKVQDIVPEHDGMGLFMLSPEAQDGYVKYTDGENEQRFPLPEPQSAGYVLTADVEEDGVTLLIQRSEMQPEQLTGLAVFCRERACYFDTLTVGDVPVEMFIPNESFHGGINRVELFDSQGNSLCRRLVWKDAPERQARVSVSRNAVEYQPFSPIAMEFKVCDVEGNPLADAPFSLSVRDSVGEMVATPHVDFYTEMLLSSELRGWISRPEYYFEKNDVEHRRALDLLLLVQGWTANAFATMCGKDSFDLRQPIEEHLTLNGRVLKDKGEVAEKVWAGATLDLKMYTREGGALEASAITDSLGRFAFVSNVDFTGDWVAQFSTRVNGKRKWSRVALDRWFGLSPRAFHLSEMELQPAMPPVANQDNKPSVFNWQDTIPQTLSVSLGMAEVVAKNGYRGLVGNRYSYKGGEKAGFRHAQVYYNVVQEIERWQDEGRDIPLIWNWLAGKNSQFTYDPVANTEDARMKAFFESFGDTSQVVEAGEKYAFYYRGRPAVVFVDNELLLQFRKGDDPLIFSDAVKSVMVMESPNDWRNFLPSTMQGVKEAELMSFSPAAIFIYTHPNRSMRYRKGVQHRHVEGFSAPRRFYSPDYRRYSLRDDADTRRTLYWCPTLRTDKEGKASAVFFSNAGEHQRLRISLRGITRNGTFIFYEH